MKYSVKISPERRKDKSRPIIVNGRQDFELITKNVQLFADIKFSGTRLYYYTGFRIDVDKFNPQTEEVNKNASAKENKRDVQYNLVNKRLKGIKASLELYFQGTNKASKEEIITLLNQVCGKEEKGDIDNSIGFFQLFEKYRQEFNMSDTRKKQYLSLINHWKRFESSRKIKISFDKVTIDLLRDFAKYLRDESLKPKSKYSPELILSPKGKNTIHRLLAMTRAFWNFARKELKHKGTNLHYPFGSDGFQIPSETYGQPIYISIEERNLLFNAKIENERLHRVRNVFVFQCLIGARVGDLCKLTKANVQGDFINYIPRKTRDGQPVTVTVPLHPIAKEIINQYNYPDDKLLPFITDQRYNDALKDLFKFVGITRIVTRLNPKTGEPEQVPICNIVSSHMARRAFIGNLFGKVDRGIISSMSGHTVGSKAFSRYYDVSTDLQQEAIKML